ncbi:MAG TPA: hypothetical protein VMW46_00770 [Candidatus Desulfaltia sp.]|nr:hypothetical protein [Candidatus Desulfaltia sp.]
MKKANDLEEIFGEPISIYTSAQAEEDGFLVRTGDPFINYMTQAVYERMVEAKMPDPEIVAGMNRIERALVDAKRHALFRGLVIGAKLEVMKIEREKGQDWFYKVALNGQDYFVAQNETGAYTLMFPEDY